MKSPWGADLNYIIAGAGHVGRGLARALRAERGDVYLIDTDPDAIRESEGIDCLTLGGSALSRRTIQDARVENADVFIAVTADDAVNLLSCALARDEARSKDASRSLRTVARIMRPELRAERRKGRLPSWSSVDVGIDAHDEVVARMLIGLSVPHLESVVPFGGDAMIAEVILTADSRDLVHRTLDDARSRLGERMPNVIGMSQGNRAPSLHDPDRRLAPGDHLFAAVHRREGLKRFVECCGHSIEAEKEGLRILVLGGSRLGQSIAERHLSSGASVTIVEDDLSVANHLSAHMDADQGTLEVVHGQPNDRVLLEDIEISVYDLAFAAVDDDHANLGLCLLAGELGVRRTGTVVQDPSLMSVARRMGLTHVVDSRKVIVDGILREIHRDLRGGFGLFGADGRLVAMSHRLADGSSVSGKKISDIGFGKDARIAFLLRKEHDEILRPHSVHGDTRLVGGDRLIIVCEADHVRTIEGKME